VSPNLSYFYWKIASALIPQKPVFLVNSSVVAGGSEAFAEAIKSFHALSSSIGNSAITANMFNVSQSA
jgi:hypothetical protein